MGLNLDKFVTVLCSIRKRATTFSKDILHKLELIGKLIQ